MARKGIPMPLFPGANSLDLIFGSADADLIIGWGPLNRPGDLGPDRDADILAGLGGDDQGLGGG